jgi:RNA polymerase sigma-70 factor (ECF subfamily)
VTAEEDLVLFDRWRDGDNVAGQQLLQRHFDSLYAFFENKCANEADELVQTTFLQCLKAREQFRKQSSFRTYLFTIARHELYRMLAKRQRTTAKLDFDVSSIAELITTPGSRLARQQEHVALATALTQLPVEQQLLLELHYWEHMEIAELAEVFDAQVGTIRVRLHRARAALKELLERAGTSRAVTEDLETMDEWVRQARRTG